MRAIGGFASAGQAGTGGMMGAGRRVAGRGCRGLLVVLVTRDGVLDLVKDVRHDELIELV